MEQESLPLQADQLNEDELDQEKEAERTEQVAEGGAPAEKDAFKDEVAEYCDVEKEEEEKDQEETEFGVHGEEKVKKIVQEIEEKVIKGSSTNRFLSVDTSSKGQEEDTSDEWICHCTEEGIPYWYNSITGVSQWHCPDQVVESQQHADEDDVHVREGEKEDEEQEKYTLEEKSIASDVLSVTQKVIRTMHEHIHADDLQQVEQIARAGIDVNAVDEEGFSSICYARSKAMVNLLLSLGARLHGKCAGVYDGSILHYFASFASFDMLAHLLSCSDPSFTGSNGPWFLPEGLPVLDAKQNTVLHLASSAGNLEGVVFFLQCHAVDPESQSGYSPLRCIKNTRGELPQDVAAGRQQAVIVSLFAMNSSLMKDGAEREAVERESILKEEVEFWRDRAEHAEGQCELHQKENDYLRGRETHLEALARDEKTRADKLQDHLTLMQCQWNKNNLYDANLASNHPEEGFGNDQSRAAFHDDYTHELEEDYMQNQAFQNEDYLESFQQDEITESYQAFESDDDYMQHTFQDEEFGDAPCLVQDNSPDGDWQLYHSDDGNAYFYNSTTGESKWYQGPSHFGEGASPERVEEAPETFIDDEHETPLEQQLHEEDALSAKAEMVGKVWAKFFERAAKASLSKSIPPMGPVQSAQGTEPVKVRGSDPMKVLVTAIDMIDPEGVERAVRQGACANEGLSDSSDMETLLHRCCALAWDGNKPTQKRIANIASILIHNGAQVNSVDSHGVTPLHLASSLGNSTLVQLLLRTGAEVNVQDCNGDTPLHAAAGNGGTKGHLKVAQYLTRFGADLNMKNYDGKNPSDCAHMQMLSFEHEPPKSICQLFNMLQQLEDVAGDQPNPFAANFAGDNHQNNNNREEDERAGGSQPSSPSNKYRRTRSTFKYPIATAESMVRASSLSPTAKTKGSGTPKGWLSSFLDKVIYSADSEDSCLEDDDNSSETVQHPRQAPPTDYELESSA